MVRIHKEIKSVPCSIIMFTADFTGVFENPTKFGLGVLTIFFDIYFMLQHYVFYAEKNESHEMKKLEKNGDIFITIKKKKDNI